MGALKNTRIVSGMRPTGPLHLGHYFGVLANWVELERDHDCFFFVADWHALTTEYADPSRIKGFVPELVKDWVAGGLDPEKCVLFQQSQVREHVELHLYLSMITPVSWLERCPTYKDMVKELAAKDLSTYGFLGYPVLMASDILLYRPGAVPVGQDQLPHLELTREIARRFNYLYGEFFPEPAAVLTPSPKMPGLDGRKMSKSYGNSIALGEDPAVMKKKVMGMLTCAKRARLKDPGDPKECNLFPYHELLTDKARLPEIVEGCMNATWGCGDCKKLLVANLTAFLEPIHAKRQELDRNPSMVRDILASGNARAKAVAERNLAELKELLNFNF
ncbi:tryptophan--tRNA ligase [Desulfolutivibrio sulfoxidireducens]|uniref:tryptophan--tRNA ligase n=1 Tax=Desulfolutivibrio sulfoxidireducens TaxID=2773299 RepID=UPI00159DC193|nr:tryptophan--tRNA ligase [Desulfolutivibrio sulfoxidireducens]QLA19028.1 tryptophan--tRNA ligase [Desulfolutivibrio sulfoxidireducens]